MKTLLFPTDLSNTSKKAFEIILPFCNRLNAKLHILHSLNIAQQYVSMSLSSTGDPTVPGMEPEFMAESVEQQKNAAKEELSQLMAIGQAAGIDCEATLSLEELHEDINNYSDKWQIDAIIMSTHGASGFKEAIIGSNAQKIVRNAKVPVLTINDKVQSLDVNKLVFASDFIEDEITDKIPAVASLANGLEAELHLLYVNTPAYFEESAHSMRRMKDVSEKHGLSNVVHAIYNDFNIDEGVIHYADHVDADLIVLVTHSFKGLKKFLSDNVAETVVNHSKRAVLTLHL